jgi:membrane protein DedA with SNARE-associated domain
LQNVLLLGGTVGLQRRLFSVLAHLTDTLTILITNLYVSTGLLGIALAMAIESCCIPLPSEIVMPLAGIMVGSGKILQGTNPVVSLILVALAGSIGSLIGSSVAYGIGYAGGRPLMLKYGRYLLISQHDADKADQFFQRWGSATAFFSRLLPVVRTYISLPAGIAKMPFARFCLYTFLGSFPWCLLLAYLGTILGNNLTTLVPIFHDLDAVIVVGFVLLVALYIWRHIHNDRKARAAHAAAQAPAQGWSQPAPSQYAQPSQWNQQTQQPRQPQWSQSQPPQWNQQPQPQQQWGAAPGTPQQWNQPAQPPYPQQWGQAGQPWPQQPQPQQPPAWPAQPDDDDRTVYRH